MKSHIAKTAISLCMLLSLLAQPLLAIAMPCDMPQGDMATMELMAGSEHSMHHDMGEVNTPTSTAMDCCGEEQNCTMPGCLMLAAKFDVPVVSVFSLQSLVGDYSRFIPQGIRPSLFRPPIAR